MTVKRDNMVGRARDESGEARELGMDRPIERRDFLQGAAIAALASGLAPELTAAAAGERAAQDQPGYYPPALTGMRGSHAGSFEDAHALRDGQDRAAAPVDLDERYDLVVVGGGISGLSAAHFYRRAVGRNARILILDNHDDFGGHAKRNEFTTGGRLLIMNGGTAGIESPTPYSPVADGLMKTLGLYPEKLAKASAQRSFYRDMGLGSAVFFDKETFGRDALVLEGRRRSGTATARAIAAFLAKTPLSRAVRRDVLAIEAGTADYMPGMTDAQKKDRLSRISYRDFLLQIARADAGVIPYYQHRTDDLWGCGIDAVSALDCWGSGLPGFQGLKLAPTATARMGYTPRNQVATGGSYDFHFPDGNASIARLLVRDLIPAAMPGTSVEDIVTARADYAELDRPGQPIRIRLSSIVMHAANDRPGNRTGAQLLYRRAGETYRVRTTHVVMASWNMMIPYICPELPAGQKAALHTLIKTPLVYTTVALTNWRAFKQLGVADISCPGGYHIGISLMEAQCIAGYETPRSPDQPTLVHMTRTPALPGLTERQQHQAGRLELLDTPFETFERNIRSQLGRALAGGGFDPARDITGITVNRWPHGYAPEYNPLVDGDEGLPLQAARARFGAIAIANADSGGGAYTDVAIDQAYRAVGELLA